MTEINYLEILKLCFLGGRGGCSGCPFENEGFPKCLNIVYKGIEDTINRQKAEIERLATAYPKTIESIKKMYATAKAEAVKEFAERLKEELEGEYIKATNKLENAQNIVVQTNIKIIDNLVKEMVGEG